MSKDEIKQFLKEELAIVVTDFRWDEGYIKIEIELAGEVITYDYINDIK